MHKRSLKYLTIMLLLIIVGSKQSSSQDPWLLSTTNFDNYYGITVANGVMGVISSPEPLKIKEVVLAGVYDNYKRGRVNNFLPNFNLLDLHLSINGNSISRWNINNFKQELDMRHATFTGTFDFRDIASVKYEYYALRNLPHSVLMNVKIIAHKETTIDVEQILETPASLRDAQYYYHELNRSHSYIPLLTSVAESPAQKIKIAASSSVLFDEKPGAEPRLYHKMEDNDRHSMEFRKQLKSGQEYNFAIAGTLLSSVHSNDPYNQAERLTIYARLEGRERLVQRHKKAWDKLWESDIQIEGDPQAQQDVHNMLYHLYSFSRENSRFSPSPMGLSGLGYNGHVFWDTEIFMYPPMLILHPEIARSMIEYRIQRLEAAKKQAAFYGYEGAMYPWESAYSGEEETPVWALSGPFEHHITADVAIAAWNYYIVTGDKEWLREKGWPVLKATAEFWQSRVEENKNGKYEIKNVVAADEWAENIDNDAYTNAAAIKNLLYAINGANELGIKYPAAWKHIAENIMLAAMDNGVTREHDTYKGEAIKQADVNLLAYPLGIITDHQQIAKDLAYYETKVPERETPAMTQAIFSLLYARLGNADKAYHWFKDAYQPNLNPPFRVMAETKGGTNPYFATGAGGVLQTVLMGFAGIDLNPNGGVRQLKTAMPKHWKKLTITGVGINNNVFIRMNK